MTKLELTEREAAIASLPATWDGVGDIDALLEEHAQNDSASEDAGDGAGDGQQGAAAESVGDAEGQGDSTADDDSGDEGGGDEGGVGEGDAGKAELPGDLIRQAVRAGMSDDEIDGFSTPAALKAHVGLLERLGGTSQASGPQGQPDEGTGGQGAAGQAEQGKAGEQASGEASGAQGTDQDLELLDVSEFESGAEAWDEQSLKLVRAARKTQELLIERSKQLESVMERLAGIEQARVVESFHDAADDLAIEGLGKSRNERGRPVPLAENELQLRSKLYEEAVAINQALQIRAERAGQSYQPPPWPELLNRASKLLDLPVGGQSSDSQQDASGGGQANGQSSGQASGHRNGSANQGGRQSRPDPEKLRRQSAARRPAGTQSRVNQATKTKPRSRGMDVDDVPAIANDPELVRYWEQAREQNGV